MLNYLNAQTYIYVFLFQNGTIFEKKMSKCLILWFSNYGLCTANSTLAPSSSYAVQHTPVILGRVWFYHFKCF